MIASTVAAAAAAALAGSSHTGASSAWTSGDPVVREARQLLAGGRFATAEALLEIRSDGGDPEALAARQQMREIIRRIRRDYSLDLGSLLARVRRQIPDITADDIERWRRAGQVQHRIIDGQVAYFRREPANLWRFCDEAKQRREAHAAAQTPAETPPPEFVLVDHLAEVVAAAERSDDPQVLPVRHRIRYTLTVKPDRPGAEAGSLIRCWLPFPQEYRQQRQVKLISASPEPYVLAPGAVDGRPMQGAPQRTIYFERRIVDPAEPMSFTVEFEYLSSAYYPKLDDAAARPLPDDYAGGYLSQRPPHILFTPQLLQTMAEVVGDETNPLARARRIFEFVDGSIRYCAEEEYSTIPSFSEKALTSGQGDCGVQAMLFITMCRAAGIPARWQSGWETKPVGWNMHDWAEFYVDPWGWLPADVSYGLQPSDDPRIRYFYFGHQDSYRLIVNLDYGTPLHPPKQSLRSEPADFQRGEVEIDERNLYFDEWEYNITLNWEPHP